MNTVSPGIVDTPLYAGMAQEKREALFREAGGSVPVKRVVRPEEIAHTVLYLMSNTYTTGSTLFVDGGATFR